MQRLNDTGRDAGSCLSQSFEFLLALIIFGLILYVIGAFASAWVGF